MAEARRRPGEALALEVYDEFPRRGLSDPLLPERGAAAVKLDQISMQRRRLNAALAAPQAHPYEMWSFHGSSLQVGQG